MKPDWNTQSFYIRGCCPTVVDMLAWATGTRVDASDHAIAFFCIGCGRVLGFLYFNTLIVWLIVRIHGQTIIYMVVMLCIL